MYVYTQFYALYSVAVGGNFTSQMLVHVSSLNTVMTCFFCYCSQVFLDMSKKWKTGAELSASFTVEVGNLDEAGQLL